MSKEIVLNGCVEIPDDMSEEAFCDFVESHGWYYGGGIYEYDEKRDGNVDSNEE